MKFELAKTFTTRAHGDVGAARLAFDGTVSVNGVQLGEGATRWLVNAGFSAPSVPSSASVKDAKQAVEAWLASLIDGTVVLRGGVETAEKYRNAIIVARLSARKRAGYEKLESAKKTEYLRAVFNALAPEAQAAIQAKAEQILAARLAEKALIAELGTID